MSRNLSKYSMAVKYRFKHICFHPILGTPLEGTDEVTPEKFKEKLTEKGIFNHNSCQ